MDKLLILLNEFPYKSCVVNDEMVSHIVISLPYRPYDLYNGNSYIDAFYPASNELYHVGKKIEQRLVNEGFAVVSKCVNIKEIAQRGGMGTRLYNQLLTSKVHGSRIALHVITIEGKYSVMLHDEVVNDCEFCGKCEDACPTGALNKGFFNREKCIRQQQNQPSSHGMRGDGKILGCDICQRVCPHNANSSLDNLVTTSSANAILGKYSLDEFLQLVDGDKALFKRIADDIGANYARKKYMKALMVAAGMIDSDEDN